MNRHLNPAGIPASPYYSQGVEVTSPERTLFVSGQVGIGSDGSLRDGVDGQARQAIENLELVLAEAGMATADLVKLTIYLTDGAHIEPFMGAAAGTLPTPPPATTLLVVAQLGSPELLVEVEAVAAR